MAARLDTYCQSKTLGLLELVTELSGCHDTVIGLEYFMRQGELLRGKIYQLALGLFEGLECATNV